MIYRSNLTCPDLTPHFKHLTARPMAHSFGHTVLSDWADKADDDPVFGLYKNCGLWTHDEAAILWNVVYRITGRWVDIGCHTGWTTRHIQDANFSDKSIVHAIDPILAVPEFWERLEAQTDSWIMGWPLTSNEWFDNFSETPPIFKGVCIDGDHEPGKPLEDAQNAVRHLADTGVLIFHDFIGQPVREAVAWCMDNGFQARVYLTPHVIGLCWRGDFVPPDHVPDPHIVAQDLPARMPDFDFKRCV
jgi:hypothetical protein